MEDILSHEEMQIVEAGIHAQRLLEDTTFQDAINTLSEQLSAAIVATKVEETDRRERLYMMHSSLVELVGILKQRYAARINIEDRFNAENASTSETEAD